MKLHKRLANLLIATMVLTSVPVATMASDYESHWASNAIEKWTNKNVIQGFEDGTFRPNEEITNAQFAKIVVELMGYNTTDGSSKFVDVAEDKWYTDYITKISAAKVMHESSSEFNPNKGITREAAAYALVNAYKLEDTDAEKASFADEDAISDWAVDSVKTLYNAGYIQGNPDGTFNPQGTLTRAELITMIDRMNSDVVNVKGVYSQNITGNLVVNTTDVVLKDMTIEGDLYLAEGIGEGEVELENVIVNGRVIVEGGGVNSIKADRKCKFNKPLFAYAKNPVHIVINGDKVDVYVGVDTTVYLTGKFAEVNAGPGSQIIIDDATVDTIVAEEPGKAPIIDIKSNSVVDKVEADVRVTIQGNGRLGELEANVDGVSSAIKPGKTSGSSKPSTPSTSGKNSWNSGFNDYDHKPSTPTLPPHGGQEDTVKVVTVEVIGGDNAINTAVTEAVEGLYKQEDGTLGTTTTPDKDAISNKVKETLGTETELVGLVDVELTNAGYKITITLAKVVDTKSDVTVSVKKVGDVAPGFSAKIEDFVKAMFTDEDGNLTTIEKPEKDAIDLALGTMLAEDYDETEIENLPKIDVQVTGDSTDGYLITVTLTAQVNEENMLVPVTVENKDLEDEVYTDLKEAVTEKLKPNNGCLMVNGISSLEDENDVNTAKEQAEKFAKEVIEGREYTGKVTPTVEYENDTLIITFAAVEESDVPEKPYTLQAVVKLNGERFTGEAGEKAVKDNLTIVEKGKDKAVKAEFDATTSLLKAELDANKTYTFSYVDGETPTKAKPVLTYEIVSAPEDLVKEGETYATLEFNDEYAVSADIAVALEYATGNTGNKDYKPVTRSDFSRFNYEIKINDIQVETLNNANEAILKGVKIVSDTTKKVNLTGELVASFNDKYGNKATITYTLPEGEDGKQVLFSLKNIKDGKVFEGNKITFNKATISAITDDLKINNNPVNANHKAVLTLKTEKKDAKTKFDASVDVDSDKSIYTIKNVVIDLSEKAENIIGDFTYNDDTFDSNKLVTKKVAVSPLNVSIDKDTLIPSLGEINALPTANITESQLYGTMTTTGSAIKVYTTTPSVVSANITILNEKGKEVETIEIKADDEGKFVTTKPVKSIEEYSLQVNEVTIKVQDDDAKEIPTKEYTVETNPYTISNALSAIKDFGMDVKINVEELIDEDNTFKMKVEVEKLDLTTKQN